MTTSSRRDFLKASATATVAGSLVVPAVHAAGNDTLRIALVGAGGRGCGAAANALKADKNVKLVAVCDVFEDQAKKGLDVIKGEVPDKVDVPTVKLFSGFEGFKEAIDSCDVAVLATSPGFRPLHLAYAVEKNKHVFMEKPHATDVAGAKSVIESAKKAEAKGLSLVSGFVYRYDPIMRETVKKIHGGSIGDVTMIHTTYLTGELWDRSGKAKAKDPSELDYQMRMWYYFTWLSGDFLVEQAIHNVDKAHWVMGELPVAATGLGGRQVRTDAKFGNIWDNFSVVYEYANGAKVILQCRQQPGSVVKEVTDHVIGTKGSVQLMKEYDLASGYQNEHNELFASIRSGKPFNEGVRSAQSTLMGIMGREAAYSGERITWKQLMASNQSLMPKTFEWGPNAVAAIAMPGKKRFV